MDPVPMRAIKDGGTRRASTPRHSQMTANQPSAVVFTHMGGLSKPQFTRLELEKKYTGFFQSYLLNNDLRKIKTVYCYIDRGIRQYLHEFTTKRTLNIHPRLLEDDTERINILQGIEEKVRAQNHAGHAWPQFVYVGLHQLSGLFRRMIEVD